MRDHDAHGAAGASGSALQAVVTRHDFAVAGRNIGYLLSRSGRRRRITLTIDERGLRVGAPLRASLRRIEAVIEAHAAWIDRKLAEWQARTPPPFKWRPDATIMVLGSPVKLAAIPAATVLLNNGLASALDLAARESLSARVVSWLHWNAQDWFTKRAAHFAPILSVEMPEIRLSNARTRWGSCHPSGRVRLNWRLIHLPPSLIDYVVVHELAHLREPNHSPRFWRHVAHVLPDHKQRRRALHLDGLRYLIA